MNKYNASAKLLCSPKQLQKKSYWLN